MPHDPAAFSLEASSRKELASCVCAGPRHGHQKQACSKLGDARLTTGTPQVERARMGNDNQVLGVGARIGWAY